MPNRVVREGILDSEKVNLLSWAAEVFYRRLMSVVDDFGRFDARAMILRSKLFPLKIDKVSAADVEKWLAECARAELVSLYFVNQKPFLEISNFNQSIRIKKSKFPPPDSFVQHMQADVVQTHANELLNPIQSESGLESESEKKADAEERKKKFKQKKLEEWETELPWPDDEFMQKWEEWKKYRWGQFNKKFKSQESEIAQLKLLVSLSNNDVLAAIHIINQSMANTWMGLFELKTNKNGKNFSKTGHNVDAITEAARGVLNQIASEFNTGGGEG
ncbi:MAG TPA: hypothetical protein VG603_01425 [Chitinophagales bacterium]|nr:hypothetical protein [Chitinophagales bacterium]